MERDKRTEFHNAETWYAAFRAHDARFDGRIYVAVSSTGIYCRPVCRVKMPKRENCSFYANAATAEAAGYRPCLKCRPELAPGFAPVDAAAGLARRAARAIEEDCLGESSLEELAGTLGVTDRHLRRSFAAEFGVTPVQYLQTRRLLLAKHLLTDTSLRVTEAAFAAGFGSVRRFNDLFKKQYRLAPSALKKAAGHSGRVDDGGITLSLGYRPPYRWDAILAFLGGRAIPGVEAVRDGAYHRTVAVPHGGEIRRGWLTVRNREDRNALAVTVAGGLAPVLAKILARARHLFDLHCEPMEVYASLSGMNELAAGMCLPGTRLPGCFDPFEMSVRAILGQQITVKAARTLAARIAAAFGAEVATPLPGLTHTFPVPADFGGSADSLAERLGRLGVIRARTRSIQALATALLHGDIDLSGAADPGGQMERLLALPGFGPWTVAYIAMRALAWPDAFPHTDYGVKKALAGRTEKEILALAEQWRPWRSYATVNLWNSL